LLALFDLISDGHVEMMLVLNCYEDCDEIVEIDVRLKRMHVANS
jgi:hypothetical protein